MTNSNFKSGFIALVGRPNAGKSTLLNALVGQKVSIVSPKPQTTRDKVLGIWTDEDSQMIFIDTPGELRASNMLGEFMVKSISSGTKDVDCIVVVIDASKGINKNEIELIDKYAAKTKPLVVVMTKTDIVTPDRLMPQLAKLNDMPAVKEVYSISAKKDKNVQLLKDGLKKYLTDDIMYFDEDYVTDRSQRFMVAEIIREKVLLLCNDEIPHGVGVYINEMKFDEPHQIWDIDANIIVEKASHKPIVIGKGGSKLKQIGTYARDSMEKLLENKVYLALWIKVKEDWRNSDFMLKEIGYNKKDLTE